MAGSQVSEQTRTNSTPRHSLGTIAALVGFCAVFALLGFEWIRDLVQNREHAIVMGVVVLEFVALGVWESVKDRRARANRVEAASLGTRWTIASEPVRANRWTPTGKQWLVIWLSATLACFIILANLSSDNEAIAAVIPLGLGVLGVWHLETRRKG